MKKILTWIVVWSFIIGGGIIAFWQVETWRLYDADWNALAMTNAENYCAGSNGMLNGFKKDDKLTKDCTANSARDNTTPSITYSPKWACEGIRSAGWDGSQYDCEFIFNQNGIWLLQGGGITMKWNDQRPRPEPIDEGVIENEKRGNRSDGIAPSFSGGE